MCPFWGRAGQSGVQVSLAFKAGNGRACFDGENIAAVAISPFIPYREMILIGLGLGFTMVVVKLPVRADIWRGSWSSDIWAKPKGVRVGRSHASAHRAITVMTQAHKQQTAPIR
jgi:hypothetical protein